MIDKTLKGNNARVVHNFSEGVIPLLWRGKEGEVKAHFSILFVILKLI